MGKKKTHSNSLSLVLVSILSVLLVFLYNNENVTDFLSSPLKKVVSTPELKPVHINTTNITTCFTPPAGCGHIIANVISEAKSSIYVQAYGFTSGEITQALINAYKKGIKVNILLDRSNTSAKYSKMKSLKKAGIKVMIDTIPGIAHNKVIIIDESKVITGSFNFTVGADTRNVENVMIVNDKEVAKRYLDNWYNRKKKSRET